VKRGTWNVFRLSSAVALALASWLPLGSTGSAHICQPDAEVGVGGALLLPSGGGLALLTLPDRALRPLPVLPLGGVVNHVARSPDGSRLALSRFSRPPEDPLGGADILITGPEGGSPLATIARERPGEVLGAPAWLSNRALAFERQTLSGSLAELRLERANMDGSERRVLQEQANAPAVSPDGRLLAFVRIAAPDQLVIQPLEGGPERVLLNDSSFGSLAFPRFSPDGRWLAFSAVGGPSPTPPTPAPWQVSQLPLLGAPAAHGHGIPWDVWLVPVEGGQVRRVTSFYDDDPSVAWSPDGRWLAVFAGESIKVVSAEGPTMYCLLDSGGYGGLEWVPYFANS
jgi:hypothetical protein